MDDKPTVRREIERKRERAHGDAGNPMCSRKGRFVYTDPQKVPRECKNYGCDNTDWRSKGIVRRVKGSKEIVHREKSDV